MTGTEDSTALPGTPSPRGRSGLRLAGALLFLPALLCCAGTLAWPTLTTVIMSVRSSTPFGAGAFVGLEIYLAMLGERNASAAAGFTLLLALMRAVVVAVVPLLLALGLGGLGAAPRLLVRLAATVPLALYIPALTGLAWLLAAHPVAGVLPAPAEGGWFSEPSQARSFLLFVDALYVLAAGAALGLAAYLAALRGSDNGRPAWKPLMAIWGVSILAALASGLQTLSWPIAITRGGPANTTATLAYLHYHMAYVLFDFGRAAAVAVLVLALLMVLGLLAAVLVIATRLRLVLRAPARGGGPGFVPLLAPGLLLFVPACLVAVAIPAWVGTQALGAQAAGPSALSTGRVLLNTLLPPVPSVLLQVIVAGTAAMGLSALRPLGRASEWLLLLFAPWLFVTIGPVSLAHFTALREAGGLNTLAGLIPPLRLSVPMLFVMAMFFKGLAARWQVDSGEGWGAFARHIVVPSLPLTGLLFVLGWLASVQEILWPLLTAQSSELYTASVAALVASGAFAADPHSLAGLLTQLGLPQFLLFVVLLGVLQFTVLERLVVTSSDEVEPASAAAA